jgi:hypothetical protein
LIGYRCTPSGQLRVRTTDAGRRRVYFVNYLVHQTFLSIGIKPSPFTVIIRLQKGVAVIFAQKIDTGEVLADFSHKIKNSRFQFFWNAAPFPAAMRVNKRGSAPVDRAVQEISPVKFEREQFIANNRNSDIMRGFYLVGQNHG